MKIVLRRDYTLHKPFKKGTIIPVSNELGKELIKKRVAKEFKETKLASLFIKKKPVKYETKDEYLNR